VGQYWKASTFGGSGRTPNAERRTPNAEWGKSRWITHSVFDVGRSVFGVLLLVSLAAA
jgi:hypothetical protein